MIYNGLTMTNYHEDKPLLGEQLAHEAFMRDRHQDLSDLAAKLILENEVLQQENRRLQVEAHTDPLTKTLNRNGFSLLMDARWNDIKRLLRNPLAERPRFSMLCIDIDDFKSVNDTYGHPVGDEALRQIGNTLRARLRESDIIGRFGGDEFVVGLVDDDLADAIRVSEEVLSRMAATKIVSEQSEFHVSLSVGISTLTNQDNWQELYSQADRALYATKEAGKGHVVTYTPELDEA